MQSEVAEDAAKKAQGSVGHASRPPLRPAPRYQRPNAGADNCTADHPATDAASANPDYDPHGYANTHPNADVSTAT